MPSTSKNLGIFGKGKFQSDVWHLLETSSFVSLLRRRQLQGSSQVNFIEGG